MFANVVVSGLRRSPERLDRMVPTRDALRFEGHASQGFNGATGCVDIVRQFSK